MDKKKKNYAEFVSLTEEEYNRLVDEYGESAVQEMIEILNNYKGSNGKTYKNDNLAIRNWVVGRYREKHIVKNEEKEEEDVYSEIFGKKPVLDVLIDLFRAYDVFNKTKLKLYYKTFGKLDPKWLDAAVQRCLMEDSKFLPAISDITDRLMEMKREWLGEEKYKDWAEAWCEISREIRRCSVYKKPSFSTPEIAKTVQCFGWDNICSANTSDMGVIRSQMKGIYESIVDKAVSRDKLQKAMNGSDGLECFYVQKGVKNEIESGTGKIDKRAV